MKISLSLLLPGPPLEDAGAPYLQGYLAHKKQPPPLGPP